MSRKTEIGFIRVIILLAVVVLLGLAVYFLKPWNKLNLPFTPKTSSNNLGATIYQQTKKPLEGKIPETNPLGAAKINPFKNIYPNPFDRISK